MFICVTRCVNSLCEIVVKSLWNRCEIVVKSLWPRCELVVKSLWNRVNSLWTCCEIVVNSLWDRCELVVGFFYRFSSFTRFHISIAIHGQNADVVHIPPHLLLQLLKFSFTPVAANIKVWKKISISTYHIYTSTHLHIYISTYFLIFADFHI